MNFGHVPAPFSAGLWRDVVRLLAKAMERGGNDWNDLADSLGSGLSQLWITQTDKPINATVSRMDGDTVEIWLCGGNVLAGALPFLETILEAARMAGATNARIIGRKGWVRVLRPYGWRPDGDELVKDLVDG